MPKPCERCFIDAHAVDAQAAQTATAFGDESAVSLARLNPRVAFQGEPGAFSEEAALKLLGAGIELVPRHDFAELFRSLEDGVADYVLAPIENTIIGPIHDAVKRLSDTSLTKVDEVVIRIGQHLIGCPGAGFEDIEAVESHPAALAQCKRFFSEHPQLLKVETADTAGSVARIIKLNDRKRAALASRRAAEIYGGIIVKENLEDDPENYTRFLLLQK